MAIGNGDMPHSQTKEKEEIIPSQAEDTFPVTRSSCSVHKDIKVTMFCQTCEILVCFKCVSGSSQNNHSQHHDHKYTDLVRAYDIQKKNLQKTIAKFQETLSTQSNLRQKLHQRLQKLKFEVLRKKTQLNRCARSLKSRVIVNERECQHQLEKLVQPAIERTNDTFQDVDYDVVSGSGLLGAAESLEHMTVHDRVPFLKNVCRVIREIDALHCKHYSLGNKDLTDVPPELLDLGSISIDRDHEARVLHKVLLLATNAPSKPKLLSSWCTIGAHSASIVWKYKKSDIVDKFIVKYYPTDNGPGSDHLTVNKFVTGRVQATLLGLKPDTDYTVHLSAINRCGKSDPLVVCIQTPPVTKHINIYFPKAISEKEGKTVKKCLKVFCFYMFLLCIATMLLLFLPLFFSRSQLPCENICFGKVWCNSLCWNYASGTKVIRRDLASFIVRLLPQSVLHYIAPQIAESGIEPENEWLDWLDIEL